MDKWVLNYIVLCQLTVHQWLNGPKWLGIKPPILCLIQFTEKSNGIEFDLFLFNQRQKAKVFYGACIIATTSVYAICFFPMSILCSLILWINHYAVVQLSSYVCYFLFYVLNRRSSNQSFSSPDYKMKWFPHRTWRCYMLEQLHTISSAHLWNSLRACIWIHGWLVVITIGDQFRNSWKKLFQIRRIMTLLESVSCHSCDPNSYYPVCCYIYFKPKVHVVLQLATSGFSNSMQKNFFCEKSYCNYIGLLVVGISSLCTVLSWMCLLIRISILWIILMKLCD